MDKNANKSISIIIPTWKGEKLLARFLPSVVRAVDYYSGTAEIIVVDDGSKDGTVEYLNRNFPTVIKLTHEQNRGFASACNTGLGYSRSELVLFLNNDMAVSEDFLTSLSRHFYDSKVFGVRIGIRSLSGKGRKRDLSHLFIGLNYKYGFFECPTLRITKPFEPFYFSCASGGAGIFDRKKMLLLNGFDELFNPFYWEDFDLSYRAWKRGWNIVAEPKSIVYHQHHSTVSAHISQIYVRMISERNRYLAVWKNINDSHLLLKHIAFVPIRLIRNFIKVNRPEILGFFAALLLFKKILRKRQVEKAESLSTDREILRFFSRLLKDTEPFIE